MFTFKNICASSFLKFTSKKYRHLVYFSSLLLELFTLYLYYWFTSFRCFCLL
nr:MAG TPA: hypothetical protein [Caudoviricetes sp.]